MKIYSSFIAFGCLASTPPIRTPFLARVACAALSCYASIDREFLRKHGHAENRAGISADSHNLRLKWPGTMEIFAVIDFPDSPVPRVQVSVCT